jgi:hypothetical protein
MNEGANVRMQAVSALEKQPRFGAALGKEGQRLGEMIAEGVAGPGAAGEQAHAHAAPP